MKFNTDSHFVIGNSHVKQNRPCQDHALDRTLEEGKGAFIVLSDGCSSGSYKDKGNNKKVIHTDIGARVITCSAVKAGVPTIGGWNYGLPDVPRFIKTNVLDKIITAKTALGLKTDDMLATCIYAAIDETGGFIQFIGDGYIAIRYNDGSIAVGELEWQHNMPLYLSYNLSREIEEFTDIHRATNNGKEAMKLKTWTIPAEEEKLSFKDINSAIQGYDVPLENINQIKDIVIFSDGVADFQSANGTKADIAEVIAELMDFKTYNGEFVKRRVSAALKMYEKVSVRPNDDFSMAVIHIDHEHKPEPHE